VSAANKIEEEFGSRTIDLPRTAAATAVAIGTVALAVLAYRLIDVFLLFFIGIAVAAALQPSHVKLCRWGVPKGLAVLLIYLFFSIGLVLIALVVGPVLIEQGRTVAAELPHTYANPALAPADEWRRSATVDRASAPDIRTLDGCRLGRGFS